MPSGSPGSAIAIASEPSYRARDAHPAWSPDGAAIAFTSTRTGNAEIFVVDVESGELKQLTRDIADDRRPKWSPDGGRIVFQSTRANHSVEYGLTSSDLFVMRADGSDVERLTRHEGGVTMVSWSPDGNYLAYLANTRSIGEPYPSYRRGTPTLYAWESGESRELSLSVPEGDIEIHGLWLFDWSPDSKRLVLNSDAHRRSTGGYRADLFVADVATGRVDFLTETWHDHSWPFGADWSPDGRRLVFAMNVDEDGDASTWLNRIAILDWENGELTKLPSPDNAWEPCWSPDGRRVAGRREGEFRTDFGGGTIPKVDHGELNLRHTGAGAILYGFDDDQASPGDRARIVNDGGGDVILLTLTLDGYSTNNRVHPGATLDIVKVANGTNEWRTLGSYGSITQA